MATWTGSVSACNICKQPITDVFTDGRTRGGPWGIMCPTCFKTHGVGLGLGKGQTYQKQADGSWLKIAG